VSVRCCWCSDKPVCGWRDELCRMLVRSSRIPAAHSLLLTRCVRRCYNLSRAAQAILWSRASGGATTGAAPMLDSPEEVQGARYLYVITHLCEAS
jgi:hypothetical protein